MSGLEIKDPRVESLVYGKYRDNDRMERNRGENSIKRGIEFPVAGIPKW